MATRTSHCGHQHISESLNRSDKNLKMKALQTLDGSRRGTENSDDDVDVQINLFIIIQQSAKAESQSEARDYIIIIIIRDLDCRWCASLWLPLLAVAVVSPHSTIVSHLFIPKTFILRNSVYSPFPNLYI